MIGDPGLEIGEFGGVTAEQVEHVLRGAHRALDAAQRVAIDQVLEALEGDQQLVGHGGEPLAERGRLGRDVVGAAGQHGRLVLRGEPREPRQDALGTRVPTTAGLDVHDGRHHPRRDALLALGTAQDVLVQPEAAPCVGHARRGEEAPVGGVRLRRREREVEPFEGAHARIREHGLGPLARLTRTMATTDLLRPGNRLPASGHGRQVRDLITTFNTMLDRLEAERATSAARALSAQEAERHRIAQELHDEIGQTLTAVLLELKRVADQAHVVKHEAGKEITKEGAHGIAFHLITDGTVSITVGSERRPDLGPGQYFGEISLIDHQPRSATVTANSDVTTVTIIGWAFEPLMDAEPEVTKALLQAMCARLRALEHP